jgi:ankyrin repeat protein
VECQFRSLQSCPRSEYHLDRMLKSLPESLDETYERMLCKIDSHATEDARRILTLLCFASRPLTVHELIDGIAVEVANGAGLDQKRRLQDANDIHGICPGLIEISLDSTSSANASATDHEQTVHIAHFSVQEYLESERIRHQQARMFSLSSATAHAEILQICLLYLLEPALSKTRPIKSIREAFPLGHYAAEFWYYHYQEAGSPGKLNELISKLFQREDSFETWIRLYDMDYHSWGNEIGIIGGSPIYYASLLGIDQVLDELIYVEQRGYATAFSVTFPRKAGISTRIDSRGSYLGNTPQAESLSASEAVVQQPLEKNMEDISHNVRDHPALQAIISEGHDSVAEVLLDKCTDVNAQGGYFGNALQAASFKGHESVVRLLLERGADVNAQGGWHGTALHAASSRGHESVVQLLLNEGADLATARGGLNRTNALQAASFGGRQTVVKLLLDKGADVDAQGGHYGNALQAASYRGHESVVKLLVDRGADVNAQSGWYGNALHAASSRGHESVVRVLFNQGANVNARNVHGDALQAASYEGHLSIVKYLLDNGADVNAQGGKYRNALHAASCGGHGPVLQLLLDRGAIRTQTLESQGK